MQRTSTLWTRVNATSSRPSQSVYGAPPSGECNTAQAITSSTNASPIVVTAASHGLTNGTVVEVYQHGTNTAANGVWVVGNATTNTFTLCGRLDGSCESPSTGNGVGGATGWFSTQVGREVFRIDAAAGSNKYVCTDSTGSPTWTVNGSGLTNPTVTAGTGGVTINLAATKDTSSPTLYILPSTPGSCGSGIAASTVSSAATFTLQSTHGQIYTAVADNAVTAGHIIVGYATTPGRLADSGQTSRSGISTTTSVCGYATTSATTGGTFSMVWDGPGFGTLGRRRW